MKASEVTLKYLRRNPSIAYSLERGLINYSALAREICRETEIDAFDAVLVACRRYRARRKAVRDRDARVNALLRKARVRVRSHMATATVEKHETVEALLKLQKFIKSEGGDFSLIEGEDSFTIVTNESYMSELKNAFQKRLRKHDLGLCQVSMIFPAQLERTPGVVARIFHALAENDINIREEMSCWTDVIFVVEQSDLLRTLEVLDSWQKLVHKRTESA